MRAVITQTILGLLSYLLLKVIFSQRWMSWLRDSGPHLNTDEWAKEAPANDAQAVSERLTVCRENRPVNKATRPAELCQWLRGGGCDSRPQVNHTHTYTHFSLSSSVWTHMHSVTHAPTFSSRFCHFNKLFHASVSCLF